PGLCEKITTTTDDWAVPRPRQRKQHHHNAASAPPSRSPPPCFDGSSLHTSYLELRSRKLEKIICRCHQEPANNQEPNTFEGETSRMALSEGDVGLSLGLGVGVASDISSRRVQPSVAHSRNNSATFSNAKQARPRRKNQNQNQHNPPAQSSENDHDDAMEVEASFGENVMDLESRE
ncbi:hypothetical protein KI387_007461, partial [Taxus chinensis]